MTPKQEAFVREYLIDLNATQAAIRAGYSEKTAFQIGYENLTKPEIAEAIAEAQKERAERTAITADRVLQEIARIAFFDMRKLYREDGSLKAPQEWDDDTAAVLAGLDVVEMSAKGSGAEGGSPPQMFTKKAKTWDKKGALELAMRHLGMLKEKIEHSGPNGAPLNTAPVFNVTVKGK